MTDEDRQFATADYTLDIEQAALRYEHAGHPRTTRSIQRYCARGDLDCLRQQTTFGDRYRITAASLARHIAQIDELAHATSRDKSRPDAAAVHPTVRENATPTTPDQPRLVAAGQQEQGPAIASPTGDDSARPVATELSAVSRYVAQLERENEFLRGEIGTKNKQIGDASERARETNILIRGLQNLVLQLQAPGRTVVDGEGSA